MSWEAEEQMGSLPMNAKAMLEHLLRSLDKIAEDMDVVSGEFHPYLHMVGRLNPDGEPIEGAEFAYTIAVLDATSREAMVWSLTQAMPEAIVRSQAQVVGFGAGAWGLKVPDEWSARIDAGESMEDVAAEYLGDLRPSEHPDRVEVVNVMCMDVLGGVAVAHGEITRGFEKVTVKWDIVECADGISGATADAMRMALAKVTPTIEQKED